MPTLRAIPAVAVALAVIFISGCASHKPPTSLLLPPFELHTTINTGDGVDRREAAFIAGAYLARYINLCGMPDEPALANDVWVTKLWTGYFGASYAGKFRISRTTGTVLYQPSRKRLTEWEMERLNQGIALTERERLGFDPSHR
jgi:hypothetical protein